MVERRTELRRRYHRKEKVRKLKAKLAAATGADREKLLYKIHRLSPFWTEASLAAGQPAEAPKAEEAPKEPKKKAPPKPKAPKKPEQPAEGAGS